MDIKFGGLPFNMHITNIDGYLFDRMVIYYCLVIKLLIYNNGSRNFTTNIINS